LKKQIRKSQERANLVTYSVGNINKSKAEEGTVHAPQEKVPCQHPNHVIHKAKLFSPLAVQVKG
jgi:hypothetical protein